MAVEKILKAYYVSCKKDHAPYSHNLLYLSKAAGLELTDNYKKLLSELNEFNIECRYPDEKFSIYQTADQDFTGEYLEKAGEFHKWISGILNS